MLDLGDYFDTNFLDIPVTHYIDWNTVPQRNIRHRRGTNSEAVIALDVDTYDATEFYKAYFELPGAKKEDIHLEIGKNHIYVHGEFKREEDAPDQKYLRIASRVYGNFRRTVNIPTCTLPDKATAKFENGILIVTVPKDTSVTERKAITIS